VVGQEGKRGEEERENNTGRIGLNLEKQTRHLPAPNLRHPKSREGINQIKEMPSGLKRQEVKERSRSFS